MLYRIITERKNVPGIEKLVVKSFSDFTMINAIGFYEHGKERSIIIEISFDTYEMKDIRKVRKLASDIKELNDQKCVLVQTFNCTSELI